MTPSDPFGMVPSWAWQRHVLPPMAPHPSAFRPVAVGSIGQTLGGFLYREVALKARQETWGSPFFPPRDMIMGNFHWPESTGMDSSLRRSVTWGLGHAENYPISVVISPNGSAITELRQPGVGSSGFDDEDASVHVVCANLLWRRGCEIKSKGETHPMDSMSILDRGLHYIV